MARGRFLTAVTRYEAERERRESGREVSRSSTTAASLLRGRSLCRHSSLLRDLLLLGFLYVLGTFFAHGSTLLSMNVSIIPRLPHAGAPASSEAVYSRNESEPADTMTRSNGQLHGPIAAALTVATKRRGRLPLVPASSLPSV